MVSPLSRQPPRRPLCMWVHALIYPRDDRVLVGRDIIVSRPASSVIASRHDSPLVVHFKSGVLLTHFFWPLSSGVCAAACAAVA